jgi:hypothetical protein
MLLAKCVGQGDDLVVARLDALGTAIEEAGLLMLGSMDRRAGADQSGVPLQKKFSVDGFDDTSHDNNPVYIAAWSSKSAAM